MTLTLAAPETETETETQTGTGTEAARDTTLIWEYVVEGVAGGLRGSVEKQLLLLPEGEPGEVWFTRWRRAPDRTYECRETVRATAGEIAAFERALSRLAAEHNFVARITPRAYDGPHV